MIRYTQHGLKKLETLFKEMAYTIRYEKGNFQSGYCLVENKRIAVINKFYDVEGRINCLLEILAQQTLNEEQLEQLSEPSLKLYRAIEKGGTSKEAISLEDVDTAEEAMALEAPRTAEEKTTAEVKIEA